MVRYVQKDNIKTTRSLHIRIASVVAGLLIIVAISGCVRIGGFSIEDVLITDTLEPNVVDHTDREMEATFSPAQPIYGVVLTSGIDATIGLRWYFNDRLVEERFVRTKDNRAVLTWEASELRPLVPGHYRLDALIPPDTVIQSASFTVTPDIPDVISPVPTPVGHIDLENAPFMEAPFAFDEKWEIGGTVWDINEVKVVLLPTETLMAIVAITDQDPVQLTEEEAQRIAKPIAMYAVTNGYLDKAQTLSIDGKSYDLTKNITVTLFNPQNGHGNRVQFNLDELE